MHCQEILKSATSIKFTQHEYVTSHFSKGQCKEQAVVTDKSDVTGVLASIETAAKTFNAKLASGLCWEKFELYLILSVLENYYAIKCKGSNGRKCASSSYSPCY